ncbi:MAG: hypothetical protein L6302_02530 [Desulfobacteraceae bacterium]|nr:hypothetical protein [Desulfobacteraceae bacterium]
MGGIAGIRYVGISHQLDKQVLRRMLNMMKHRGSHLQICSTDEGVHLGISYCEPTSGHNCFIYNKLLQLCVVLDGGIFLKNNSASNNNSLSDSQVILNLYDKHGNNFVEHIDGSYAIAIWDKKEQ